MFTNTYGHVHVAVLICRYLPEGLAGISPQQIAPVVTPATTRKRNGSVGLDHTVLLALGARWRPDTLFKRDKVAPGASYVSNHIKYFYRSGVLLGAQDNRRAGGSAPTC